MQGLLLIALAALAAGQTTPIPEGQYSNQSPIERVTKMLEDMREHAIKEQKHDEELYQNMDCWCTTNKKQKDEATKAAAEKISELTENSGKLAAQIETLTQKRADAKKEMGDIEQNLKEMKSVRDKEHKEYEAMFNELSGSTKQLAAAIKTLRKVNPKPAPVKKFEAVNEKGEKVTFLQVQETVKQIHQTLSSAVYAGRIQEDLLHMLAAFPDKTTGSQKSLLQNRNPGYQSYASRSGEIVGILEQMFGDMNKDAQMATEQEDRSQASYEKMKASEEERHELLRKKRMEMFKEMTKAKIDKANTDNDIKNTKDALSADQKFLMDLSKKCESFDKNYEHRTKVRGEEIVAVGEALKILHDDDARDTFMKNKAAGGFLQVSTLTSERQNRHRALSFLRRRLSKTASTSLLMLASSVKLDSFKKVISMIEKMTEHLRDEQKEEFDENQQCIADIRKTENDQVDNKNNLEDSESSLDNYKQEIAKFNDELKKLTEEITNLRVSIKEAGENRKKENDAFQEDVNNQRSCVAILDRVLARLQAFYARKAQLLQQAPVENKAGEANKPEPKGFKTFHTSQNANGVMVMIQTIIKDAERADQTAVHDEQASQTDYAKFVTESNDNVSGKLKEVADKNSQKANTEGELADEESKHGDLKTQEAELNKQMADHHSSCDFLMKNFDVRQAARAQEIDDIQRAKAILSGAKFN